MNLMHFYAILWILSQLQELAANLDSLPYLRLRIHNKLPILDISEYCSNQISVLLDSGSSQFWLADLDCSNCRVTGAFCPHVHESNVRVQYYTGWIEGSDSFLNICGSTSKFLCAKSIEDQQLEIMAHGILGLKKGAIGYNILEQLIQQAGLVTASQLHTSEYIFSYGHYESKLIIQSSGQQALLRIVCDLQWQFAAASISFEHQHSDSVIRIETNEYKYTIDTGSNAIGLPSKMCQLLIAQMHSLLGIDCLAATAGVYCNQKLHLNMNISLPASKDRPSAQIHIPMQQVINQQRNSLNIFCSPSQTASKEVEIIVLGYPLLQSYAVGFNTERMHINLYPKQGTGYGPQVRILFLMVLYMALICWWGLLIIKMISEYQNKKSKTLTI